MGHTNRRLSQGITFLEEKGAVNKRELDLDEFSVKNQRAQPIGLRLGKHNQLSRLSRCGEARHDGGGRWRGSPVHGA